MKNKLAQLALLLALALPASVFAQPDGERGPRHGGPDNDGPRGAQAEGPDRRGGPERDVPVTVDNLQEAINTIRELHGENVPNWISRIEQLSADNPEAAAGRLSRFPRIGLLIEARQNNPAEFQLYVSQTEHMRAIMPLLKQRHELARAQDQEGLDALQPQIREHVAALFDIRVDLQRIEIQRMRERLERAEADIQELVNNRDTLIDQHMQRGWRGPHDGADGDRGEGEGDRHGPRPDRRRPDADNDADAPRETDRPRDRARDDD